jgi:Fe2+ or Zn2+ uptake regulation protein
VATAFQGEEQPEKPLPGGSTKGLSTGGATKKLVSGSRCGMQKKAVPARSEDFALAEELAGRGLRATRQRVALLRLLRGTDDHPTVLQLHRAIRREQRRVSRKTVYEILSSFVHSGLAACVTEGGEPAHYEARVSPHYHARCRICDRLFDLPATVDSQIRGRTPLPEGFRVEGISVTLQGVCSHCREEV